MAKTPWEKLKYHEANPKPQTGVVCIETFCWEVGSEFYKKSLCSCSSFKTPPGDDRSVEPFKFHLVHGKNIILSEVNMVARYILCIAPKD